jgi:dipeptidyl aminopeptidase/acylaminoacyl peptidase
MNSFVRRSSRTQIVLAASLLLALPLAAKSPVSQKDSKDTPVSTPRAQYPNGTAISPDGKIVAWTLRQTEGNTLHLTELANPAKEKLVSVNGATGCSNTSPIWSPDGEALAFLSTCTGKSETPEQEQLFVWSHATGNTQQLTHVVGNLSEPAWSPDGKSIAFLFVENATRVPGGESAQKPWAGVIGEDGVEIQRLAVVSVTKEKNAATTAQITPADLHVFHFDWSPDSKEVAYIASAVPGENNWWIAQLYTQKLGNNVEKPVSVLDPQKVSGPLHGLQIAVPRWSPDGKRIAFIGGLMSDEGVTGGDVWVIDAKPGAEPTNITPDIDGTPAFEAWLDDDTIGFVEERRGHIILPDYKVSTRALVPNSITDYGEVSIGGGAIKDAISFTKAGSVAFTKSSFTHPPEVWAGDVAHPAQLTHLNDSIKPFSHTESIEWQNEGLHVQGWLTYPRDYDPKKKYPLIVNVHGGPSSAITSRWTANDAWAADGYFNFQPNPRGSYGQGEAFVQANRKDFGYGDLRDILAGMDAIEAKVSIDKSREGITGWSYGGFMTMFAITQTHRFRAAVAGAGISNWQSYYGENSIDQWMIPFFGASVYDDPAVYAKSSAINYIKQVTTPTLIIVGDRDGECPAPQSFELWHALRDLGVKTQLVVYPNEGHGFTNPDHLRDRNQRIHQWFAENMPESRE